MASDKTLVGPDGVTPLRRPPMPVQVGDPSGGMGGNSNNPAAAVQFGPGAIPAPYPLGGEPRQQDYKVGYNLPTPPGEGRILDYRTARQVADIYEVLRTCIEIRKNELASQRWDIVPHHRHRSKKIRAEVAEKLARQADQIREFFESPEAYMAKAGRGAFVRMPKLDHATWLKGNLEDYFVIGAECFYPRPKMNGELLRIERVDAATIKPLLDDGGRTPDPPAYAYSQWIKGQYRRHFTLEELVWATDNIRNSSPYPLSHVERLSLHINWALRYGAWNTAYFTDGSIPEMVIEAPSHIEGPELQELNNWWDDVMKGDPSALRRLKFIPNGSKPHPLKPFTFDYKVALWLATITCITMDVSPTEVGLGPIASEGLGGKGNAEMQAKSHRRRSLKPLANWQAAIFTRLIQQYFGTTDLVFSYVELQDENEEESIDSDSKAIQGGIKSLDQVLMERGDEPVGVDRFLVVGKQLYFVKDLQRMSKEGALPAGGPAPAQQAVDPAGENGGPSESSDPAEQPGSPEVEDPDLGRKKPQTAPTGRPAREETATKVAIPLVTKEVQSDLGKWRTKAIRRFSDGRRIPLAFESDAIPGGIAGLVAGRLAVAGTLDAVKAAFAVSEEEAQESETDAAKEAVAAVIREDYPQLPETWPDAYHWERRTVRLDTIAAARRPGGRNMAKVEQIAQDVKDGKAMPPLIVVQEGDDRRLVDGYHRWLGYDRAGKVMVEVYLGTPVWHDLYKLGGDGYEQERGTAEKAAATDDPDAPKKEALYAVFKKNAGEGAENPPERVLDGPTGDVWALGMDWFSQYYLFPTDSLKPVLLLELDEMNAPSKAAPAVAALLGEREHTAPGWLKSNVWPQIVGQADTATKAAGADQSGLLRELLRYRNQAIGDLDAGGHPARRPFKSAALPAELTDGVRALLVKATTAEGVMAAVARSTSDWLSSMATKGAFDANLARSLAKQPHPGAQAGGEALDRPTKSDEEKLILIYLALFDSDITPKLSAGQPITNRLDLQERLQMRTEHVDQLAEAIYNLKVESYRAGVNDQLTKLGIEPVESITDEMVLQSLRSGAQRAAQQVAGTYNRDLSRAIDRETKALSPDLGAQERANALSVNLEAWVRNRAQWKAKQVSITEANAPYNQGTLDFADRNDLGDTMFEVTPDLCQCKGCWYLVDGSPYTFAQAKLVALMLPLHPNCYHVIKPVAYPDGTAQRIQWTGGKPKNPQGGNRP